jgi:hypothetical protein
MENEENAYLIDLERTYNDAKEWIDSKEKAYDLERNRYYTLYHKCMEKNNKFYLDRVISNISAGSVNMTHINVILGRTEVNGVKEEDAFKVNKEDEILFPHNETISFNNIRIDSNRWVVNVDYEILKSNLTKYYNANKNHSTPWNDFQKQIKRIKKITLNDSDFKKKWIKYRKDLRVHLLDKKRNYHEKDFVSSEAFRKEFNKKITKYLETLEKLPRVNLVDRMQNSTIWHLGNVELRSNIENYLSREVVHRLEKIRDFEMMRQAIFITW